MWKDKSFSLSFFTFCHDHDNIQLKMYAQNERLPLVTCIYSYVSPIQASHEETGYLGPFSIEELLMKVYPIDKTTL